MKIKLLFGNTGTFHNYEGVSSGDVVDIDDDNAARYCALGLAEQATEAAVEHASPPAPETATAKPAPPAPPATPPAA